MSKLLETLSATETYGQGSRKQILCNPSRENAVLVATDLDADIFLDIIDQFESELFTTVKSLLKAPRDKVLYLKKTTCADPHLPYYFSARKLISSGVNRHIFEIANSKVLRSAANLSSKGPRDADYATFSNSWILGLSFDEQCKIIDKAVGNNWRELQKSLKPSAKKHGLIFPDLRNILRETNIPHQFLNKLLFIAEADNEIGEISHRSPKFLIWIFLAYLRKKNILLLPIANHFVEIIALDQNDFFGEICFSRQQLEIINQFEVFAKKYTHGNRRKITRILQTIFLSSQVSDAGDVNPELFITINNAILSTSSSKSYKEKTTTLVRAAYDFMARFWNEHSPESPIHQPVESGFKIVEQQHAANDTLASAVKHRRTDPFWFADVPNDKQHFGHPIPDYLPNEAVQKWAEMLRRIFPTFKIKDPVRHRVAGCHWLSYINTLAKPPLSMMEVVRSHHINDIVGRTSGTFRARLNDLMLTASVKNDILSSLSLMFSTYIRLYEIDARNPIEFDLDRFVETKVRGKTTRTPLSPELLEILKEVNSRNDFELSRSLRPTKLTVQGVAQLRHYRRVIDPVNNDLKLEWWPGLAILIDLMLTIPLRGFQARWLDTGEGDEYVLDLDSLLETPNKLKTARKGRKMGVFMSFSKGIYTTERLLGLRITTNKRAVECDGRYEIAWCPDNVRNNIIKMLNWQRHFNPIKSPIRAEKETWTSLLRSEEVTALIPEIFPLFRDPGSVDGVQPPTYQQVQTYWNSLCAAAEDEIKKSKETNFRLTRDRVRKIGKQTYNERVALYDLHTLRVSGITALIEAGLPPNFVQEIVGHSAIVMTLYYYKARPGKINEALTAALKSRELSLDFIPELISNLSSYDTFLLNSRAVEDFVGREMLGSSIGNGTYHVLSHGICPGGDCRTGGEYEFSSKEHQPLPRAGACSLCRYRITGPMFLAGLVINANKIMAELHTKGQEVAGLNDRIRQLQREGEKTMLFESRREIAYRELEDLWREWAAEHKYVHDCSNLLGDFLKVTNSESEKLPMLAGEAALKDIAVMSSYRHPFHLNQLLSEASAFIPSERHSKAILDRDNFLNELLAQNDIAPFLLRLEQKTRLKVGNMLGRLMAESIPDDDLQDVHKGKLPFDAFTGLRRAVNEFANLSKYSKDDNNVHHSNKISTLRRLDFL